MSANYLHSIADENPDLHKQLGCMNGIFQLFNRQNYLTSRRISGQQRKRLPPGESGNCGKEHNSDMQKDTKKNLKEGSKEKERTSVESSRSSFSSSSCSSTFSSIDCNKLAQPEPSFLGHSILSKDPSQEIPKKQLNSSLNSGKQSIDIQNVVKESIQRETCQLSVKTKTKTGGKKHVIKHVDSPRPLQVSKPANPRVSALDRSFRVPGIEEKYHALPPKDAPRFSYDGRESRDKWKSATKVKELLPRLSLDSRESSIRRAASEPRSNSLLEDLQQRSGKSGQRLNLSQEPGNDKRLSTVVAKLMGLEAFPDSMTANKCCPDENLDAISTSSRKADESKYNQFCNSPRPTQRDPSSPKLRNTNSTMKPSPRFPLEPAPWRPTKGSQGSQNSALMSQESQTKPRSPYPSVYGQIEKRLTELEFKKSGKDLRALKQILEAMQKARESIENKEDECSSNLKPQTSNQKPNHSHLGNNSPLAVITTPTIKGSHSPKKLEPSIAIKRAANAVQMHRNSGPSPLPIEGVPGLRKLRTRDNADSKKVLFGRQTAKDLTPKNNQFREPSHQALRLTDKRNSAGAYTSKQTSVSPRMHHNKHEMEKQSHPITTISDSSRARRPVSRQNTESCSAGSKSKPKSRVWQQDDDQLSEISNETRHLSCQGHIFSVQSESNISSASQNNIEVTSNYRSEKIKDACQQEDQMKEVATRIDDIRSESGATTTTLERPSPVSVLDTTFYTEESPSPVKKISNAFIDEDNLSSDEAASNPMDVVNFLNSTTNNLAPKFDGENLENITHLDHKLRKVNLHDETDEDCMASLFESTNPVHRYVTQILLASGLLKDLGPSSTFIQLHSLGHLINPHMFHVLEQAKGRIEVTDDELSNTKRNQSKVDEKIHRKLIFDTTNEILASLFTSAGFSDPWNSPNRLGARHLTGKKLVKKLCSEMDHLQANPDCCLPYEDDGLRSIYSRGACHSEIPGLVLDIERLIFKDLICEVVSGEVGLPGRPNRHCRQLFPN